MFHVALLNSLFFLLHDTYIPSHFVFVFSPSFTLETVAEWEETQPANEPYRRVVTQESLRLEEHVMHPPPLLPTHEFEFLQTLCGAFVTLAVRYNKFLPSWHTKPLSRQLESLKFSLCTWRWKVFSFFPQCLFLYSSFALAVLDYGHKFNAFHQYVMRTAQK